MHDSNQTPPGGSELPPPDLSTTPEPGDGVATAPGEPFDHSQAEAAGPGLMSMPRALLAWLGVLLVFGAGGVMVGQQELAMLAAVAGIFVAAHAADRDSNWRELYLALGWVVPALGFILSLLVGAAIWQSSLPGLVRGGLAFLSACSAGVAILTVPSPAATVLARTLFRDPRPGHVLRLSARLVVLAIALAVPGWFAAQLVMEELLASPEALMDRVGLGGGLIGYVLLAFAGVGFTIRRNLAESVVRLGLVWPGWRDLLAGAVTLGVLWLLNTGADMFQERFLPGLWASDRRVTEAISANMGLGRALLLGLSAGIGEEITLRGALQPRLGILLTSAFFAALHVQYSWFGMLVILALGLVLGWVRKRTNTSVAILAHVAYDVIAVLGN